MYKIVKKSIYFTIPLILFALLGIVYFSFLNKGDAVIWLNNKHSPFWDMYFKAATFIGDGAFIAIVCISLLILRPYWFIQLLTAILSNTIVIYILKREIFNFYRPSKILLNIEPVLVEGIRIHEKYSFPSGHTNSMFVLGIILTLLIPNKKWGFFFFFLAFSTAISRMYLFQHFFMDVYAGGLTGFLISLITFHLFDKTKLKDNHKLHSPIWRFNK